MDKREKIREFDNRPLNTGSTINCELANQPTRRAIFTSVVYYKKPLKGGQMEQSYQARRENLRRRKKSKSSNYSGKFLPLLSEIVALRFLRIRPLTMLPFTLPTRGDKRNHDPPIPPSHGSFLKMIVIYAIVSSELLLTSAANSLDLGRSQNIRTY